MNQTEIIKFREELSHYLQYVPAERLEELQILPTDAKEACIHKMLLVLREFSVEDEIPYKYIVTNFDMIPRKYRLEVLLKVFNHFFYATPGLIINLFHKHMMEETAEEKEERINANKTALSNVMRGDWTISCYRKVSMGDISPVWSFEFSTNLKKVQKSMYYTEGNVQVRIAGYFIRDIRIEDVLFCGNNHEIFLVPEGYTMDMELEGQLYSSTIDDLYIDPCDFENAAGGFFEEFNLL